MKIFTATVLTCFTLTHFDSFSQTKSELQASKKAFEGRWINKTAQRHLTINYDNGLIYATVNDWQGKMSDENNTIDAYKAWIEKGKLVMPESKTDLRCPYCEITKKEKVLLYRCRAMNTNTKQFIDSMLFVREKP